jgi:site-specific recombinase XerD
MGEEGRQTPEEEEPERDIEMTRKQRGIYEREPGSGIWWIRYADANSRLRREKVGNRSAATQLYQKRKTQVRQGEKLPENFRAKAVAFLEIGQNALAYSKAHKRSYRDDKCRMAKVLEHFGVLIAEQVRPQDIEDWLDGHEQWTTATKNRYLALIKLTYRLAERNGWVKVNPARLVRMRKENNQRVRYLNQHAPLPTNIDYLATCHDEESRLAAVIRSKYGFHFPEFEIALHTGMRRSEQYSTDWSSVNVERKVLTIPRSKHGDTRHIPLNSVVLEAFRSLLPTEGTEKLVFLNQDGNSSLQGNKHWFEDAVREAGVRDFTWHDLRHTFASRLVMAGEGLRMVQEVMGHKSISTTCRYAHLAPAQQLAAFEKLVGFNSRTNLPPLASSVRQSGNV